MYDIGLGYNRLYMKGPVAQRQSGRLITDWS